jgi:hypothetical protein
MERNSFTFLIEYDLYHIGFQETDNHSKNCTEIFYIKSKYRKKTNVENMDTQK